MKWGRRRWSSSSWPGPCCADISSIPLRGLRRPFSLKATTGTLPCCCCSSSSSPSGGDNLEFEGSTITSSNSPFSLENKDRDRAELLNVAFLTVIYTTRWAAARFAVSSLHFYLWTGWLSAAVLGFVLWSGCRLLPLLLCVVDTLTAEGAGEAGVSDGERKSTHSMF